MNHEIDEIIARFLASKALPEEVKRLNEWLEEDESHTRYFFRCKNLYDMYHPAFTPDKIDKERAWRKVMPVVDRKKSLFARRIGIAAAILLLAGIATTLLLVPQGTPGLPEENVVYSNEGNNAVTLTLATGKAIRLDGKNKHEIGEGKEVVARVENNSIKYIVQDSLQEVSEWHKLDVPRGKTFFLTLSDSTKVWVNAGTQMRFPVKFAKNERKIFVSGEVYLEVAHNAQAPFTVITKQNEVVVLGTSFNVKSYQEERNDQVTLVNGKVKVASPKGQALVLAPGEQAIVEHASGKMTRKVVNTNVYCGWRKGEFTFQNNSLEEILNSLGRRYDFDIRWEDEALKKISFSGETEKKDEIKKLLKVIEHTGDVKFTINGKTITVSKL